MPHLPPERISTGNARNRDDVQHVITGSDMVISCLGTDGDDTLSVSMKHVIDIMEEENMKRLITVGTAGILKSRQHPQKFRFETNESKRKLTRAAEEHAKVFTMLEASGLDWTAICPTYLPDGEATGVYRFEKDFCQRADQKSQSAIRRIFSINSLKRVTSSEFVSGLLINVYIIISGIRKSVCRSCYAIEFCFPFCSSYI